MGRRLGSDRSSISCWVLECWQWRWDPRNVKPSRGSSLALMEMRTVCGFGFLLSRKRRDKEGKRGATGIYGCSLSWLRKCYYILCSAFFTIQNTHTKHIFIFFEHWKKLFKPWYQTHFFVLFTLKTRFSTILLNHSFYIFSNNNFWTLWPNGPLIYECLNFLFFLWLLTHHFVSSI